MTEQHVHNHEHDLQKIYMIENLGCANCAAKMEQKMNELPQVESATITFATKQLRVTSHHAKELLPILQEICASIEPDVVLKEQEHTHSKEHQESQQKGHTTELIQIGIAAILFGVAIGFKNHVMVVSVIAFFVSYLILGAKILQTAGKNLVKGHVFDENFLMSIATLAAFTIGDFAEAVGVMLFFRIGELFEKIAVEKSRSEIMNAVDLRPETVLQMHGHHTHEIPANRAQVDDILLVRVGDRIPLDGVVVEGESRIDTAAVTGEPVPIKVGLGDAVISGCINTSGVLQIKVEKTLEDSMVTRILHSVENAAASKPKIDRFITRFAKVYTPCVVAFALMTAILPSIITGDWEHWIYTAITFLVISCPCALVLSIPLAFFAGIGAGSQKGILFKGGLAIETLRRVQAVVLDKTGTITKGEFAVQKCVACDIYTELEVLEMAATCEMQSNHPIANSIVAFAKEQNTEIEQPICMEEIAGKGICADTSRGQILCGNRALFQAYGVKVEESILSDNGSEVLVACNGKMAGCLIIDDALKSDSKEALNNLKQYGMKTIMLTGDKEQSARMVATKVGIDEFYAELLPEQKLERLQEVRQHYGKVMFVGDGINDAPVLAVADIGAAMGNGADAAIEAADVVFMTSSMTAIPQAMQIARKTNAIAIQNVIFALITKGFVMLLGVLGFANMWMAVFADTGVAMLCVLNSIRILRRK